MSNRPLADADARDRVETGLDTSFLVEAGAGAGKTTLLVKRLLRLVERGDPVDGIAAVTFTRKAANELRQRFQERLEARLAELRDDPAQAEAAARVDAALRDIEQAFIGTIHSFCGRLLREHPLEAQVDPGFRELDEVEAPLLEAAFWERWLARCRAEDAADWRVLLELGLDPRQLDGAFAKVVDNPDVTFDAPERPMPDPAPVRAAMLEFLDRLQPLIPADEPAGGWDDLQKTVRRLRARQRVTEDWAKPPAFCLELEAMRATHWKAKVTWWPKPVRHAIRDEAAAFFEETVTPFVRRWHEHRYGHVVAFVTRAADAYRAEREATGRLIFADLLRLAARLLRESPSARRALGERWRRVLVDEFQDTDPMQAEVCLLLASDPDAEEGNDWRAVRPRPGSLVVVGDPKQSIYRFRRADIRTYDFVRSRFTAFGQVERLTENFRSIPPIANLVNAHFDGVFPAGASEVQAPFARMSVVKPAREGEGVFRYAVQADASKQEVIIKADARSIAAWIAARVAAGEREPGDFLVLAMRKDALEAYASAIAAHGLPVTTDGGSLMQEVELRELVVVLRALADPSSPLLVAAALEGLFFGASPADLWDARRAGVEFRLGVPRPALDAPTDGAARVAAALGRLDAWLRLSRAEPVDILLARLLDETGLLPYAASQLLGDNRGGALLHLIEAVRGPAGDPAPDLRRAIETIDRVLDTDAPDALLMPGRSGAARVMNLHKAKGLEAKVVILAGPCRYKKHPPDFTVVRGDDHAVRGWMMVRDHRENTVALPPGWTALAAREAEFVEAEKARLLYVAATRAKYELVVAQSGLDETDTYEVPWLALAGTLERQAATLELVPGAPPPREVARVTPDEIAARVAELEARRAQAAASGWSRTTVTQETKRPLDAPAPDDHVRHIGRGKQWGTVVHRVFEARGRGRTGESLRRFANAVIADEGASGSVDDLLALVARLEAEGHFQPGTLVEVPIVTFENGVLREGVIDAARLVDGKWQVLDWKTDLDATGGDPARRAMYQEQADAYAAMLRALTGQEAEGRLIPLG